MTSRKMKTTPAVTLMKVLLGIFTTILWVIGACLLGSGVYSKTTLGSYDTLTHNLDLSSAPYVMIGVGTFVIIAGLFGTVAICKENSCMLRFYAICLGLLFVAEIICAVAVIVLRSNLQLKFKTGMDLAIKNYNSDQNYQDAADQAQSQLHCCGSEDYMDYWTMGSFDNNTVPSSCCIDPDKCVQGNSTVVNLPTNANETSKLIYTDGCPTKVFSAVNSNLGAILGAMFGIAAFQLLGLFLSCCLASTINANKYELV